MSQSSQMTPEQLRGLNISQDDLEKMVSDAVFFLLVADQKKSIIRKADLVKACDLQKRDRRLQDHVVKLATSHLSNTFGIEVRDLPKTSTYFLVNKLSEMNTAGEFLAWDDKESAHMGLTFLLLGLILMSNDKVSEETLLDFLKSLGLWDEDRNIRQGVDRIDPEITEMFDGDVRKFVNDTLVTKQHYLRKEKIHIKDEVEQFEYFWGDRAEAEIKGSDVFKMVCQLYDCEPRMFKEQYERVKERENLNDEDFIINV